MWEKTKTSFRRDLLGDQITTLKTVTFKFQNTATKKETTLMPINYFANCLVDTQNIQNC